MRKKRTYTPEQVERRRERNAAWQKANPDKMRSYFRRHDLKRHYGITPEVYDALFNAQGGVCAICGKPPEDDKKRRLVVDHNHGTSRNRGLLCICCNRSLHHLEEDPDWGTKALNYLARYIEQIVQVK
jgi:hypothetical protein